MDEVDRMIRWWFAGLTREQREQIFVVATAEQSGPLLAIPNVSSGARLELEVS